MYDPARLSTEIRDMLAEHASQHVDRVALYMFLNTVPGGHFQDRYSEADIRRALDGLLAAGEIEEIASNLGTPFYRLRR